MYDTVIDADDIFHVTEWKKFRMPSWGVTKKLFTLKKPSNVNAGTDRRKKCI